MAACISSGAALNLKSSSLQCLPPAQCTAYPRPHVALSVSASRSSPTGRKQSLHSSQSSGHLMAICTMPMRQSTRSRGMRLRVRGSCDAAASDEESFEEEMRAHAASLSTSLKGTSIFLVGMMGSGKSTVGKVLADMLGYFFFDSDTVVEAAAGGTPVAQIFAEEGEEAFRDAETQVLAELSSLGRLVVATGGGAVLRPMNWSYLSHGICVYLDVPVSILASRVVAAGTQSRPLLSQSPAAETGAESHEEVVTRLSGILEQRIGLYNNADTVVSLGGIMAKDHIEDALYVSPQRIAHEVLQQIDEMVKARREKDMARQRF